MNSKTQYQPSEYWEKRLSRQFSLAGVGHLGFNLRYNIWLYKARLYTLRNILRKRDINFQKMKILDIGVGTGFYINFWEKLGVNDITGIDITTKSVKELTKKYPKYKFIKANISDKKIPLNEKFDIITAFDVLFHIVKNDDFEQAINNIKKLSHKNAMILITDNFLHEHKSARGHEYDRTLRYYKKVLSYNSMRIEGIKPIFYFMNTPIDIERISNKLIRIIIKQMWRMTGIITSYSRKLNGFGEAIIHLWVIILYCADRIILKYTSVGPSTKLLIANFNPKNKNLSINKK